MKGFSFHTVTMNEKAAVYRSQLFRFVGTLEPETFEQFSISEYNYDDDPTAVEEDPKNLKHSEETMKKVYDSMREWGLSDGTIEEIVNSIQNKGVLFRERT